MIVGFKGWQDKGKTALALLAAKELILYHGYSPDEFVANISVNWPGSHCLTSQQMRQYIRAMVSKGLKHKVILLDEVDRLFPARFWQDAAQTEALIGLWQDEKLFNYILYTAHRGTSLDIIMRLCTQIEIEPDYDEKNDCIDFTVYNAVDGFVFDDCAENVSKTIFPDYNRWAVVEYQRQKAGQQPDEIVIPALN